MCGSYQINQGNGGDKNDESKSNRVEALEKDTTSMFVIVENHTFLDVVYHKDTKVMYAVSTGSYNLGTFTLLVDADGKPMIYDGE